MIFLSYNDVEKRDIIMSHYLKPKFKNLNLEEMGVEKFGESCSDYLKFSYQVENNTIKNLIFNGNGCAFFLASTDLLCEKLNSMTIEQSQQFIEVYEKFLQGIEITEDEKTTLGKLAVFDNVKKHHNRLNCCTMLTKPLKNELFNK
ncbi:iron-sulfur cluster assembly scaffold protein [Mycoplasmopsis columbina]|uniref:iron-sulfur cluster assembly scaffold protein n=1 Tax=Mycoplasmopsis columbina TaxID=114881 RepID=UPI0021AD2FFC